LCDVLQWGPPVDLLYAGALQDAGVDVKSNPEAGFLGSFSRPPGIVEFNRAAARR
jgi:hypothetical protein